MTTTIETISRGLIRSSKVEGAAVYNVDGGKLGTVDCLMIDKKKAASPMPSCFSAASSASARNVTPCRGSP